MSDVGSRTTVEELESRLEQAQAEMDALRRELAHTHQLATLGTLTAGIAHEINNILTPVLAYAQLAQASPHDTALGAKALDRAASGVRSASRITEAVLGFARGDEDADVCELDEVVESAIACLGRDPARDGVTLETSLEPGLAVDMSPLALQQVLLNLILNAIRAMQQTPGGRLQIGAARSGATARLTVTDTGPGIPPELVGRLFEPFVTSARRGAEGGAVGQQQLGGSGLGLAVCKRLVEQAGGTIEVDPGSGRGAKFTIVLGIVSHPKDPRRSNKYRVRRSKKATKSSK